MRRITPLILLFVLTCLSESFAIDSPQNFTLFGDGGTTPPPTPEWNFSVPRSASRASGVAPLSVFFSAGLAESSPSERSFHDYEYSWDFGDSTSGTWGTTGASKNTDKGPVAAHVYETPGSYTATLTVRNASGVVDTETFNVMVTDPDAVFSGTNTTCISDTAHNNFSGCPSGANQVATDNISTMTQYVDAGQRVLLHRDSSWTADASINFPNNSGPVSIGAFGTCLSPDELGICGNAPAIIMTGGTYFIDFSNKQDWRLSDLHISAPASVSHAIGGVMNYKQIAISRMKLIGFNNPIMTEHWKNYNDDLIDQITLYENNVSDGNVIGVYIGSERLAILGNIVSNSKLSHVLRVWQSYMGVTSHNILSGASLDNTAGRHALKFHGPFEEMIGTGSTGTQLTHRSTFNVISDNIFGGSGPWPVSIGPQNAEEDEHISDLIFEKNKILANYGLQSSVLVTVSLMFEGRYITVRNNIMDGTGGGTSYTGIAVERRGVEWTPLGNRVYNNTIYRATPAANGVTGISVNPTASDTIIRNNYISFPGASNEISLTDNSGNAVASNNIITDTPYFVDPNNVNPLLRNFRLRENAPAINQGKIVPIYDDFVNNDRLSGTSYDVGAFEY